MELFTGMGMVRTAVFSIPAILSATISLREVSFRIEMKATFCGLCEGGGFVSRGGQGLYFGGTCFLLL